MVKNSTKNIIALSIIAVVLIIFLISYNPILKPSYISMKTACFPEDINLTEQGFVITGVFKVDSEGKEDIEVRIPENPELLEERKSTIKHEWCHAIQFRQGRIKSCKLGGSFKYIQEVECYIAQRVPDDFYNKIYGEPLVK